MGLAESFAKAFFLPDSDAPFSAAVPLRFPVLEDRLWGLVFGASPPSPAQPSPAQPSPQLSPAQLGPAQPSPTFVVGLAESSAKASFLPDSNAPFSAAVTLRFWSIFGLFGAAVPLRFPVLDGRLWGLVVCVFPPQASEASPAQPAAQPSPAQPSSASPKVVVGLAESFAKAFFLPDSDAPFSAAVTLRFWPAFGSFGAAVPLRFPVLEGRLWGLVLISGKQNRQRRHRSWSVFGRLGPPCRCASLS